MKRAQAGFTLVELMVVVAIIATLSALLVSVSGRTYGASPTTVADQIAATAQLAKLRAVSTRTKHELQVFPDEVQLWAAPTTGFATSTYTLFVQRVAIPSGVSVWDVVSTVCAASPCTGAPGAANGSLNTSIIFNPDGSSTGGTIFVTDSQAAKKWRISVYRATGSSYAHELW